MAGKAFGFLRNTAIALTLAAALKSSSGKQTFNGSNAFN